MIYIKLQNGSLKITSHQACNISRIFAECPISVAVFRASMFRASSVAMFRASREQLGNMFKENIFKKILNGKVAFLLKVYDLMITNVDLLANASNHKLMFHSMFHSELFTNIYFKNIPRISLEYCNIMKMLL